MGDAMRLSIAALLQSLAQGSFLAGPSSLAAYVQVRGRGR